MAQGENEGAEALYAPLLRPAPVDAALLVAVRRGLEAVPVFPVAPASGADLLDDRHRSDGAQVPVCTSPTAVVAGGRQHGNLARRRRP